jgi:hypothetical protein
MYNTLGERNPNYHISQQKQKKLNEKTHFPFSSYQLSCLHPNKYKL